MFRNLSESMCAGTATRLLIAAVLATALGAGAGALRPAAAEEEGTYKCGGNNYCTMGSRNTCRVHCDPSEGCVCSTMDPIVVQ